jgi:hypothetical protein
VTDTLAQPSFYSPGGQSGGCERLVENHGRPAATHRWWSCAYFS